MNFSEVVNKKHVWSEANGVRPTRAYVEPTTAEAFYAAPMYVPVVDRSFGVAVGLHWFIDNTVPAGEIRFERHTAEVMENLARGFAWMGRY